MTLTSRNGKLWITFYHQSNRYRRSLDLDDTKKNRKLAEEQIIPEIVYKLNHGMFFKSESKQEEVPTLNKFSEICNAVSEQVIIIQMTKRYQLGGQVVRR